MLAPCDSVTLSPLWPERLKIRLLWVQDWTSVKITRDLWWEQTFVMMTTVKSPSSKCPRSFLARPRLRRQPNTGVELANFDGPGMAAPQRSNIDQEAKARRLSTLELCVYIRIHFVVGNDGTMPRGGAMGGHGGLGGHAVCGWASWGPYTKRMS